MANKINYPFQVSSLIQDKKGVKKTLGIDAQLSAPNYDSDNERSMPLEMHSGFSRFVMTLIHKAPEKTEFVKANVPAPEVPFLYKKTEIAMKLLSEVKTADSSAEEKLSPAYTERLTMGAFKGKTPAEYLLQDNGTNKDALIQHGKWLSDNLEKYPANKAKIEAIRDAIHLLKEGKLEKKDVGTGSLFVLYDEQMKTLRSMKDDEGRYMVYGIKVVCDTSRNLPFTIEITNCYCVVDIAENGKMNPRMRDAVNIKKISMNMTEKDWFKVIWRMKTTLEEFEMLNIKDLLKIASEADKENRRSASDNN